VFRCIATAFPILGLTDITLQLTVLHSFQTVRITSRSDISEVLNLQQSHFKNYKSRVALLYFSRIRLSLEVTMFGDMQQTTKNISARKIVLVTEALSIYPGMVPGISLELGGGGRKRVRRSASYD